MDDKIKVLLTIMTESLNDKMLRLETTSDYTKVEILFSVLN